MKLTLIINGESRSVETDEDTPLLWVLRESCGLTGTKFGCGIAACGACTVHVDGAQVRSCSIAASTVQGMSITTIDTPNASPLQRLVQQAWIDHQVPQCGYCQSGMIMATTALLARNPHPSDEQIDLEITNLCRCGTYERVRRAIHSISSATVTSSTQGETRG